MAKIELPDGSDRARYGRVACGSTAHTDLMLATCPHCGDDLTAASRPRR